MVTSFKLSKIDELLQVGHTMNRSIICCLLYVTSTRPNVMQVIDLVSRFQAAPRETHVVVVKIILRYLKGTLDYGLWYSKRTNFTLKEFTDVDWAGSADDRKSTSGVLGFIILP